MDPVPTQSADDDFVFVSYAHGDAERISSTISHLEAQGINIWMDDSIQPGVNWQSEIAEAITDSGLFLIFVSPKSVASSHCNRELNFAVSHEKPILAIQLEETNSPAWELALNDRQAILKYPLEESRYLDVATKSVVSLLEHKELIQPRIIAKRKSWNLLYALIATAVVVSVLATQWLGIGTPGPEEFAPPPNSVAVLPFASLGDDEDDYFAAGMTEEILNALANIDGLQVIARTSSFHTGLNLAEVPEIGRRLNVSKVLAGSVRRINSDLRISVQLLDSDNGEHVWSRSYDRQLEEVFEIQKNISRSVAEMMQVTIGEGSIRSAVPKIVSMEAYDHYLLGRFHLNGRSNESIEKATEHFELAIQSDPGFVSSYSGLADSYYFLNTYGNISTSETIELMAAVIDKARLLEPDNSEILTSSGSLNRLRGFALQAERDYRSAIATNPNSAMTYMWLGNLLAKENKISEADEAYKNALRLDPLNTAVLVNLGRMNFVQGRADEGFGFLQRAADVEPNSQLVYEQQGYWMSQYGMPVDAMSAALEALRIDEKGTANITAVLEIYLQIGAFEEARYVLDHAIQTGSDSWRILWIRAEYHFYNGEINEMDAYLQGRLRAFNEQSIEDRRIALVWAGVAKLVLGDYQTAASYFQEGLLNNVVIDASALIYFRGLEALAYRRLGEIERAQDVIDQINRTIAASLAEGWQQPEFLVRVSEIRALEGKTEEAVEYLNQAVSKGFKKYLVLERSPLLDPIRNHPEFLRNLESLQLEVNSVRSLIREGLDFDNDIVKIIR